MPRRLHLLASLLFSSVLVAIAPGVPAQTLSSVQYLPGDDDIGPAPLHQDNPSIARGGDQFLAVWRDYRTGGSSLVLDEGGADIFAARLDANGNVLDTTPIPISQAAADQAGDQTVPLVAWNGTHWLVMWKTQVPTQFFWAAALHAARVAPDGTVLDPEPTEVFAYPFSSGLSFALASDGANWLAVTQGSSGGETDLIGVRIGPDGDVLDPGGVVLRSGGSSLLFSIGLAFATDTYLLTYDDGSYRGQRLSPTLQLLGSPFLITGNQVGMQPASNGQEFLVLSTSGVGSLRYLYAHRISRTGTVLDPGGRLIVEGVFTGPSNPCAAWGGTNWFATYWTFDFSNGTRLWAARVAPDGTVLDPDGDFVLQTDGSAQETSLAEAPGGGVRVVFEDDRPAQETFDRRSDISTLALSPALDVGPLTAAALGAPSQIGVDVVARSGGSLVVFRSIRSDMDRILAHPLDAEGQPVLPGPVEIGAGPRLSDPQVAWNGSVYLVTWSVGDKTGDIVARRVAADGTPVDPAPIVLMEGFDPDVAALGDDFLVIGIQQTISPQIQEPLGMRVDGPTGTVLDASPLDLGSNHTRALSLTSVGGRWLLVYQRHPTHDNPSGAILGTLIEPSGTVAASLSLSAGYRPSVASSGTTAFAAWEENDADQDDVYGRRVLADGTLLPEVTVGTGADQQTDAAVGWDGTQFVTLYQDLRNVTFFLDERSDIYGTRVGADGTVLDPTGFAVLDDPLSEMGPAVAGRDGVALLMASDFREASPYASYRIAYRFLGAPIAPVTVSVAPVSPPVVVPASGGSFTFTVTLTNTTDQPQPFEAWSAATGPVSRSPLVGPVSATLTPGATVTRTIVQDVPGAAPAGTYTYTVNVGSFPGVVSASASFPVEKKGGTARGTLKDAEDRWSASGWNEGFDAEAEAAASRSFSEDFALSAVYPNPFSRRTRLTLEVGESQRVEVSVFDALGRRVAVLHDGLMKAGGSHTLTLEAAGLPSGVYVVRTTGETFSATRRLTLIQ